MSWLGQQLRHSCHTAGLHCRTHVHHSCRAQLHTKTRHSSSRITASAALASEAPVSQATPDPLAGHRNELPDAPRPTHTNVKTAEYVSSAVTLSQCPKARWPEFAVIGRSNVGKSSLINMLTGRKALALTSKTPGNDCASPTVPVHGLVQAKSRSCDHSWTL